MYIEELNDINKRHMLNETRTDLKFEWEDKEIINTIMKQFKDVYPYSSDPKEFIDDKQYLNSINMLIHRLKKREISSDEFLKSMETILKEVLEKYEDLKYQYKYDIDYYREKLKMSNRLLIDGDGGIGKSYFLFKLEETLNSSSIQHLCIYCKYTKYIPNEVINEIKSKINDFYFIIDAFNELEKQEQEEMISVIESLLPQKNVNIIISYRTKNLDEKVREKLELLLENTYTFKGVEYESSLTRVIETYGVEATKFIDILETNNPFYLKMLYEILDDDKIRKECIGNLVQITYILETYIKKICGKECWENTKKIGNYMFENGTTHIDEDELKKLLSLDTSNYIKMMMKNSLLDYYIYEDKKMFVFNIQRLSDFIIARSLNQIITDLNDQQIIQLINEKISQIYSLAEPFIILIFDRFKDKNIKRTLNIIKNSNLRNEFELSTLRKIHFKIDQIDMMQKTLKVGDLKNTFLELGGYYNRPFNCTNYVTEQFIETKEYIDGVVVKFHESDYIMKLKNMLYSIIFINEDDEYIKEAFWYSFWLTSSSNSRIRNLATKVLFDIVDKFNSYAMLLIEFYEKIEELYIRKSIIKVLTSLVKEDKRIVDFLKKVLNEYNETDAEIIFRIDNYLNVNTEYILLNKYNIYENLNEDDKVDKELDLNYILFIADIYEKYLLHFQRYNKEDELSLYDNFILNDKQEIFNWNKDLNIKFICVGKNGYCKYSSYDDEFKKNMKELNIIDIDNKKMFLAFQKIFKNICQKYKYNFSKESEKFDEHLNKFEDSLLKKILLLSQDILLGSLMCNYYTKEFSVFNDDRTFGYKLYEPFRLDEEEFRIYTPVSIYCEKIDKLNKKIYDSIDIYGNRDEKWYKDCQKSIENVKNLIKPIKEQEKWSLISADIHRYVWDNNHKHIYTETYDLNISIDSTKKLIGDTKSKELTTENDEFIGNIQEYEKQTYNRCTKVHNIEYASRDFKETYLMLPPTEIIKEFNLVYNRKYSTWELSDGTPIVYCDNNSKDYYNEPLTGAIYIKTEYLNKIIEKHNVKYWAYTQKSYLEMGWNDDACLHIELDAKGNINAMFKNNSLFPYEEKYDEKCKECKYCIYQEHSSRDYFSFINDLLGDEEEY